MELTPEQKSAFLADLTELSRKHGVEIGGCGCCESPFLSGLGHSKIDPETYRAGHYEDGDGPTNGVHWVMADGDRPWQFVNRSLLS